MSLGVSWCNRSRKVAFCFSKISRKDAMGSRVFFDPGIATEEIKGGVLVLIDSVVCLTLLKGTDNNHRPRLLKKQPAHQ